MSIWFEWMRKCTFSLYILTFFFFHFGPYILILPLLVPKPINAWHLSPYRHPTNRKCWRDWWHNKIIIKKNNFGIKKLPEFKLKKINLLILTKWKKLKTMVLVFLIRCLGSWIHQIHKHCTLFLFCFLLSFSFSSPDRSLSFFASILSFSSFFLLLFLLSPSILVLNLLELSLSLDFAQT